MANRLWTRDEFILALDLYFRIPFGQINKNNPDIIKLAAFIGRTPSSVGMRLSNYANCDPKLKAAGIKGLEGGQQQCQPYWDEFSNSRGKLMSAANESRIHLIESNSKGRNQFYSHISEWDNLVNEMYDYEFQDIVSKNYHEHCAISGMKAHQFLVGCHIIPSCENEEEAMKAHNGIFLNILYARAFVEGLIGFDTDYKIHFSSELKNHKLENGYHLFKRYEGEHLQLGDVVVKPNTFFLEWHMDTVFNKVLSA
jgi:putative restriction endonuclease